MKTISQRLTEVKSKLVSLKIEEQPDHQKKMLVQAGRMTNHIINSHKKP